MNSSNATNKLKLLYSAISETNGWLLFILFCLFVWLFSFFNAEFVVTEEIYNDYVESKMQEKYDDYEAVASEFEEDLDEANEAESIWGERLFDFAFIVLQSILQFGVIAAFVYVALILFQYSEQTDYGKIYKHVLLSEFIFFLPKAIKYSWFSFQASYTFEDVRNFHPFSIYALVDPKAMADWMVYPLRFLNAFELMYVLTLAIGVSNFTHLEFRRVVFPVAGAYTLLMTLWIVFRVYLSIIL